MSNGTADKVAQKVKSIVIDLGKDRDDDHVDIYVPKDFDESLISFKNFRDEDFYQIWHSSQADVPKGSNRVGFRNEAADELIAAIDVESLERDTGNTIVSGDLQ